MTVSTYILQRSTLHCVLCCTGVQRGGGAVQLDSDDARLHGLHRLRLHGGQRGALRHLRQETRHRASHLRQPQPHHRPGATYKTLDNFPTVTDRLTLVALVLSLSTKVGWFE